MAAESTIWTACGASTTTWALNRGTSDRHAVYVTTTGGTMTVPAEELEPVKLVRVEVGAQGAPLRRCRGGLRMTLAMASLLLGGN